MARGTLPSITADALLVVVYRIDGGAGTVRSIVDISNNGNRALQFRARDSNVLQARTSSADGGGAQTAAIPSGVRIALVRRTAATAGTTGLRLGINAETTASETPATSAAPTRLTIAGNEADTPGDLAPMTLFRLLLIRDLTPARLAALEYMLPRMAAAHYGAVIRG
jgi:hypothetical protein